LLLTKQTQFNAEENLWGKHISNTRKYTMKTKFI